jgi:hypothetical protein
MWSGVLRDDKSGIAKVHHLLKFALGSKTGCLVIEIKEGFI